MKKYFYTLVFLSLIVTKLFAQAPQGLNYQAVALRSNGTVVANHAISLQLSVIDSIANGNAVYTETQNTTTDAFGLFSVVIGNGAATLGTFATINWGKNYKFLKTEIDTTAGNSFVLMGITQFMSTPYALYANKTKPTFADVTHPDGFNNSSMVMIGTTPFIVPTGKNLYTVAGSANPWALKFNADSVIGGTVYSSGQVISYWNDTLPCMLVDKTVDWILVDLISTSITPPVGKSFIIVSAISNPTGFAPGGAWAGPNILLNGIQVINGNQWLSVPFVVPSGQTLSATLNFTVGKLFVNGYFIDN